MKDSKIKTIDRPRQFEPHEKFFSVTDRKGIIESCNEVFLRVADFQPEQIIGKPHNIIRHPDMPQCVFKLLWDYLLSGRSIGAYVKNLASTGEYYWVYAVAAPIKNGFYSIRIKPTTKILSTVQSLYSELLKHEKSFEDDWREGMKSSEQLLLDSLKSLNFHSYDEFMSESFRLEFSEHINAVEKHKRAKATAANQVAGAATEIERLAGVFNNLPLMIEAGHGLTKRSDSYEDLDTSLHNIAINAAVQAEKLGREGAALGVISQEIASISKKIASEMTRLVDDSRAVQSALFQASFASSLSLIQAQMGIEFGNELSNSKLSELEQTSRYGMTFKDTQLLLTGAAQYSFRDFSKATQSLSRTLEEFDHFVTFLARTMQTLEFSYVIGKTLCARLSSAQGFDLLLSNLIKTARTACEDLNVTKRSVISVREMVV